MRKWLAELNVTAVLVALLLAVAIVVAAMVLKPAPKCQHFSTGNFGTYCDYK